MKAIRELDKAACSSLKFILCDIDDTITTGGKLTRAAYNALWDLYERGYGVIPVTGRPAGWCDMIIREWPVKAVVGENGAFVYYNDGAHIKTFTHPSVAGVDAIKKLEGVKEACLEGVPGCRVARDQFARIYDLAIDFNEDPPYLGLEAAEKIRDICVSMGAEAKISSIHVNAWFGNYNKLSMTELFMKEILKEEHIKEKVIFFGDSPNDEPMFEYFPLSCAVANILPFEKILHHLPSYVTSYAGGEGFAEAAAHILTLQ
ncbi:MAG: HAD-IIB family hydrolase [Oscillospiraceae bacterium]